MFRTRIYKLRPRAYPILLMVLYKLRLLYNAALQQRIEAWTRQRKSLSFFDQCKDLTQLRQDSDYYRNLSATMERLTVFRRIDLGFKSVWRRLKCGQKPGFPRFKGRGRFNTLVFGKTGWKIKGRRLYLQGIGSFSLSSIPRLPSGTVKGIRLKYRADRWEVQFVVDIGPPPAVVSAADIVGVDVGLSTFATLSDGSTIDNPRFVRKSTARLKAVQQELATKKRGSNRRAKVKSRLARLHVKINSRRGNFLHQLTRKLVDKYKGFAVEDLDIVNMVRGKIEGMSAGGVRGTHRGIMDAAWAMFAHYLGYKAEEAGKPFMRVDPKGTTQECSRCGAWVRKGIGDRRHVCPVCGLTTGRDENAAENIKSRGCRLARSRAESR